VVVAAAVIAGVTSSCGFGDTCSNEKDVLAQCPATFDGTKDDAPRCGAVLGTVSARTCGGLIELSATALPGRTCHYDVTTHGLVGVRLFRDKPEPALCGRTEELIGRQLDGSCRDTPPTVVRDCGPINPDAGVGG
jgi:hypothetical protein